MGNLAAPPATVGTPDAIPLRNFVIAERDNPRSLVNLVPKEIAADIEDAVFEHPELFGVDEKTLMKRLGVYKKAGRTQGKQESEITTTDNRLRMAFWMEYDRAMEQNCSMNMVRVFGGTCAGAYFNDVLMKNPDKVAWLLCPPTAYLVQMQEALHYAVEEMRTILAMPVEKNGKIDTKLAELKLKIFERIDNRVKGAVIQRTQSVNVNVNKTATPGAVAAVEDLAAIEAKLAELEKRAEGNRPSVALEPEVLDVEVISK